MTDSAVSGETAAPSGKEPDGGRKQNLATRLYLGTGGFDIVGKRRIWYIATLVILAVCFATVIFRGFEFGINFVGGTKIQVPANSQGPLDADEVERVYTETLGEAPSITQSVGSGRDATVEIRTKALTNAEVAEVKKAIFEEFKPLTPSGEPSTDAISDRKVSGTWGSEISQQALIALGVFLVLVMLFLTFYFELRMAAAALAALFFDLTATIGVYAMIGFEVTPATVVGALTILGYSLYDTVVVFDKVKENTAGLLNLSRNTYAESANLALNQVLMRSINTSLTSLLPVLGLLLIGAGLLGAGTLKDLALVLCIGITAGTLSSIFIATPVLVDLKMRQPEFQEQASRVESRRALGKRTATQQARVAEGIADAGDDEVLQAEVRKENAMAAASSVPGRNLRKADQRRIAGKGKPSGKPSGKRKR